MSRQLIGALFCSMLVVGCNSSTEQSTPETSETGAQQTTNEETSSQALADSASGKQDSATTGESDAEPDSKASKEVHAGAQDTNDDRSVDELISDAESQANDGELDNAVATVQLALNKQPKDRRSLVILARFHFTQAIQLAEADKAEESRPYFLNAATTLRTLHSAYDELQPLEQRMLGFALYKEAAIFAVQGDTQKALASLSESFQAGFENLDTIRADDDLKSLRELPEYKSILGKQSDALLSRFREATQERMQSYKPFDFDFSLPDLEGGTISLADLKGKTLIVDFWGTWCPPCRQEIPHFVTLKEKYADQGLEIVGINYEDGSQEEIIAKIEEFHTANKMNYPCVIGDETTQSQVPDFQGFPTTLFIDRNGTVRFREVGYHSLMELEAVVMLLLEQKTEDSSSSAQ